MDDVTEMTAEQILASIGAETDAKGHTAEDRAHPVNQLAKDIAGKPAKLPRAPKAEKAPKTPKAEKPIVVKASTTPKDPNAKRVRVTKHEQAMYDNVGRLGVALNRTITVTRSDEVRYMRALFSLSVGETVLASSLTVNEIEMLLAFQENVAKLDTSEDLALAA